MKTQIKNPKNNNPQLRLSILTSFFCFSLMSFQAWGFLTLNETAEILPENNYQLGVAPQVLLESESGANISVFADAPVSEDMNARLTFGGGTTDFFTQASLKWVPFPDVDKQPAIGGRVAIIYARDEDQDLLGFQITPIISKKTETEYGQMIPYVGLPLTFFDSKKSSYTASQFTVGAEWFPDSDYHVGAELNLDLKDSLSSASVFFNFPFDGSTGYKKRQ